MTTRSWTASDLVAATRSDGDHLTRLHESLAAKAEAAGVLDVAYCTVDTPIGPLLLATTDHGLVRVAFQLENFDDVLTSLAGRVSPRILAAPRRLDAAARQLDEYFGGRRRDFELPLDFSLSSGFRQVVQHYLPQIGYGRTATYKQVAEGVGNPRAVRAVGTACATNPLPVVVPCHRVLRSDGGVGGYRGGAAAKETLLRLERVA